MSRGTVTGLPVRQPIVRALPSIYQGHVFLDQFTGGLDEVWAADHCDLDCLHAYLDPALAPADFVHWLGGWVGLGLDEDWPVARRRRLVAAAVDMFAKRGTVAGLRREVELYTDGVAHVDDPGGTFTSSAPGSSFDQVEHTRDRTVRVVVDVPDASTVNWNGLQEIIRSALPAHLPVEVELREVHTADAPTSTADAPTSTADAPTSTEEDS